MSQLYKQLFKPNIKFNLILKYIPKYYSSTLNETNIINEQCQSFICLNNEFQNVIHKEKLQHLLTDMSVHENFLSESEEVKLLDELEPYMKRLRYEFDHWDDAIHGFRETERLQWNEENSQIINRLRELAFPKTVAQLKHVHILDLAPKGFIKPHIDAVRFCGNTIAGISLLSDCVMRLVHENHKSISADVLLKRRSLYIMKDSARYNYTHEILPDETSLFKGKKIPRNRRISVICRNEPIS